MEESWYLNHREPYPKGMIEINNHDEEATYEDERILWSIVECLANKLKLKEDEADKSWDYYLSVRKHRREKN